jgi:hypothetical protein
MKTKLITLYFIIAPLFLFSQINFNVGLRAKYDFSGNTLDNSGNGFNAINNGAVLTVDRNGNQNSAYSFNGVNQNIIINNFDSLITGNEISISVWVKADNVKTQGIITLNPDTNIHDRIFAGVYYNHNGVSSTFWDYGDVKGTGRLGEVGTFFQPGWEHYVFISSATQDFMQVYRNGSLKLMKTGHSGVLNKNRILCIGGNLAQITGGTNYFFKGAIDDIRIYDRVLNPIEVVTLYRGYDNGNVKDLRTFITNHPNARPGFNENLYVNYQNIGNSTMNGYVEFRFDTNYTFLQASPMPDSLNGNYLGWNVNNIPPAGQGFFKVEVSLPASIPLGTSLQSTSLINPIIGDTTDFDNYDTLNQVVVNGYDPNYLEVLPSSDISPSFVSNQEFLYYIIHFQNTGTASAVNVRTENLINTSLLVSSVEVMYSSHPYTFTLSNSNILTIDFNNINLPDSSSDPLGSNGFVVYRVKPLTTLQIGDSIYNKSDIYFDFNSPISTNSVITKVTLPSSIINVSDQIDTHIKIFPNPIENNSVKIEILAKNTSKGILTIIDYLGRVVYINKNLRLQEGINSLNINVPNLSKGIYSLRLSSSEQNYYVNFLKL